MKNKYLRFSKGLSAVRGPLVFIKKTESARLGDLVQLDLGNGSSRRGQLIELDNDNAVVQIFGVTDNIDRESVVVKYLESAPMIGLSPSMIGRVFNGAGAPVDGGGHVVPRIVRDINGNTINPVVREEPNDFIETGFSSIDCMNTLVRGQKLPIFAGAGLPANEIVAHIVGNSKVRGEKEKFAVVFAGMGITEREADYFLDSFERTGALARGVVFMNRTADPVLERLLTPRYALAAAEYLAFDLGLQVLVVMSDMTQYCNALREVSSSREEIPGRRGYPGYMYTDLASIYERAGRIKGNKGSVTQLPVVTMPDDDITHPIVDLTGYITEGQIVLDRALHRKGIWPPIDILPSLSRLMHNGIGEGRTRADHQQLSDQLYMSYSDGIKARETAGIVGEEGLSEKEKAFMAFADGFEHEFINQREGARSVTESLSVGWKLLSKLPRKELVRIEKGYIKEYLQNDGDL